MTNPVLILTHNCLDLTKRCVASVHAQDIPTRILFYDNDSSDGTRDWLPTNEDPNGDQAFRSSFNNGVSAGWNWGLDLLFRTLSCEHVLVINNDTMLPPHFYSTMLGYELPFITGNSSSDPRVVASAANTGGDPVDGPDFSAFLIRRAAWQQIGMFDEDLVHYCGDLDYHVRAHRVGIRLVNSQLNFYHERSSTHRLADPMDRRRIEKQADSDRAVFKRKWGCDGEGPEYAKLFTREPTA